MRAGAQLVRNQALKRVGNACEVCGWGSWEVRGLPTTMGVEMHHILPVFLGGDNSPDNAILLCPNHHALAHQLHGKVKNAISHRWDMRVSRSRTIAELREFDTQAVSDELHKLAEELFEEDRAQAHQISRGIDKEGD